MSDLHSSTSGPAEKALDDFIEVWLCDHDDIIDLYQLGANEKYQYLHAAYAKERWGLDT